VWEFVDTQAGHGEEPFDKRGDEIISDLRGLARPRLIVISGPSGVGKDTVIDRMRALYPDMFFAVTATSRDRRPGEIDGIHYHFLSREQFGQMIIASGFIESAEVYGNFYGVPRAPIRDALAGGRDAVVKVDTQGAQTFRRLAPGGIFIFISPPSIDELARRLRSRKTDGEAALTRRLRTAQRELATVEHFDYVVFNESDREDETVEQIIAILTAERSRLHQPGVIL
jgi:guanylate kinase